MLHIIGAIHRYYESRRRLFNDEQPNRREAARETKSKSRKTAFQKQVCVSMYVCVCVRACVYVGVCVFVCVGGCTCMHAPVCLLVHALV